MESRCWVLALRSRSSVDKLINRVDPERKRPHSESPATPQKALLRICSPLYVAQSSPIQMRAPRQLRNLLRMNLPGVARRKSIRANPLDRLDTQDRTGEMLDCHSALRGRAASTLEKGKDRRNSAWMHKLRPEKQSLRKWRGLLRHNARSQPPSAARLVGQICSAFSQRSDFPLSCPRIPRQPNLPTRIVGGERQDIAVPLSPR